MKTMHNNCNSGSNIVNNKKVQTKFLHCFDVMHRPTDLFFIFFFMYTSITVKRRLNPCCPGGYGPQRSISASTRGVLVSLCIWISALDLL